MSSVAPRRKPGIYVAWTTVTYRSVLLMLLAGVAILAAAMRFAFPQFTQTEVKAASRFADVVLERVAGMAPAVEKSGVGTSQQAHFTALDGTVRVKKANSNSWMSADYSLPLEKGDVVQTGSEGMAKVVFNDGTNYTVKQDSLIVIEENSANEQQQTNVAVAVSTGTVDLATVTRTAEVLVVAAGRAGLVGPAFVAPGAVVVDVGTNTTADGGLAGDVDPAVAEVARALSPVPGGVGPVTTAVLLRHVVSAAASPSRS